MYCHVWHKRTALYMCFSGEIRFPMGGNLNFLRRKLQFPFEETLVSTKKNRRVSLRGATFLRHVVFLLTGNSQNSFLIQQNNNIMPAKNLILEKAERNVCPDFPFVTIRGTYYVRAFREASVSVGYISGDIAVGIFVQSTVSSPYTYTR